MPSMTKWLFALAAVGGLAFLDGSTAQAGDRPASAYHNGWNNCHPRPHPPLCPPPVCYPRPCPPPVCYPRPYPPSCYPRPYPLPNPCPRPYPRPW